MPIEWILVIFFVFVTLLFIVIAAIFPEWVGITGKKAQEHYDQAEADGAAALQTQQSSQEEQSSKS